MNLHRRHWRLVKAAQTSPANTYRGITVGERRLTIRHLGDTDLYSGSVRDDYDAPLQKLANELLTHESVVFDVGANIGLTSCIFSQRAATIYAFEPNPPVFRLLAENVAANKLENVKPYELAIGARPGTINFCGESAFGYMTKDKSAPEVRVETVDRLVDQLGVSRLDFLKIDVEGFEPDVLAGARETIKRYNPTIYMEFNAFCLMNNGRGNPVDFAEQLQSDFATMQIMRPDGPQPAPASSTVLVHENLFKYGSVNDLVLKDPRF
jgi:FkbM family methyltransferase